MNLALIRHGKKDVVMALIEASTQPNKDAMNVRFSRYEPGFPPERCRWVRIRGRRSRSKLAIERGQ
jgi:hypothetical protein